MSISNILLLSYGTHSCSTAPLCRDVTAFLLAYRRYLGWTWRPSAVPVETAELGGFGHERPPQRALMSHGVVLRTVKGPVKLARPRNAPPFGPNSSAVSGRVQEDHWLTVIRDLNPVRTHPPLTGNASERLKLTSCVDETQQIQEMKMLLFIQVFQNHRSFREHHQRSWSSLAFRPVPHTTPKPWWRSGSFRSCSVLYSQPRGGGEGAVRATPVVPTYLLSPCVPPPPRLHRVPCVRRGSQVTPASYTEPVVRLGGWGMGWATYPGN